MLNNKLLREQMKYQHIDNNKEGKKREEEYNKFKKSRAFKAYTSTPGLMTSLAFDIGMRDPNIRGSILRTDHTDIAARRESAEQAGKSFAPEHMGEAVENYMQGSGSLPIGAAYLGFRGLSAINRQKRQAYEKQYSKELGTPLKVSRGIDAFSNINRLSYGLPLGLSMMGKGLGLNNSIWGGSSLYSSLGAAGMGGMMAAGVGAGILKSMRIAKLKAKQSTAGNLERKYSTADQYSSDISRLVSSQQLEPSNQLQISLLQQIERHTSTISHIAAILENQKNAKEHASNEISTTGYNNLFKSKKPGVMDQVEHFLNKSVAKYDPVGQLLNTIIMRQLPKSRLEEIDSAYRGTQKRKELETKLSKQFGTTRSDTQLMHITAEAVAGTGETYEEKMLALTKAHVDISRFSSGSLVAIRQSLGVEKHPTNYENLDEKQFFLKRLILGIDNIISNIPAVSALYNLIKLPFEASAKVGSMISSGITKFAEWGSYDIGTGLKNLMTGGLFKTFKLGTKESIDKELGIYKSEKELSESFMGKGFPIAVSHLVSNDDLKIKLLRNIYGVLKTAHGIQTDDSDLVRKPDKIWDATSQQFLTQEEKDDIRTTLKMQYAKDKSQNAFFNWVKAKATGRSVDEVAEENVIKLLKKYDLEQDFYEDKIQKPGSNIDPTNPFKKSKLAKSMVGATTIGSLAAIPFLPILGPILGALGLTGVAGTVFKEGYRNKNILDESDYWKENRSIFDNIDINKDFNLDNEKEIQENNKLNIWTKIYNILDEKLSSIYNILYQYLNKDPNDISMLSNKSNTQYPFNYGLSIPIVYGNEQKKVVGSDIVNNTIKDDNQSHLTLMSKPPKSTDIEDGKQEELSFVFSEIIEEQEKQKESIFSKIKNIYNNAQKEYNRRWDESWKEAEKEAAGNLTKLGNIHIESPFKSMLSDSLNYIGNIYKKGRQTTIDAYEQDNSSLLELYKKGRQTSIDAYEQDKNNPSLFSELKEKTKFKDLSIFSDYYNKPRMHNRLGNMRKENEKEDIWEKGQEEQKKQTSLLSNLSDKMTDLADKKKKEKEGSSLFDKIKKWLLLGLGAAGIAALFFTKTGRDILGSIGNFIMKSPTLGITGTALAGASGGFMVGGIPGMITGGLLGGAVGIILPMFSEDADKKKDFFGKISKKFTESTILKSVTIGGFALTGAKIGFGIGAATAAFTGGTSILISTLAGALIGGIIGLIAPSVLYGLSEAYDDEGKFSIFKFIKAMALYDSNVHNKPLPPTSKKEIERQITEEFGDDLTKEQIKQKTKELNTQNLPDHFRGVHQEPSTWDVVRSLILRPDTTLIKSIQTKTQQERNRQTILSTLKDLKPKHIPTLDEMIQKQQEYVESTPNWKWITDPGKTRSDRSLLKKMKQRREELEDLQLKQTEDVNSLRKNYLPTETTFKNIPKGVRLNDERIEEDNTALSLAKNLINSDMINDIEMPKFDKLDGIFDKLKEIADGFDKHKDSEKQPTIINTSQTSIPGLANVSEVQTDVENLLLGHIDKLFTLSSENLRQNTVDYAYG